MKKQIAAILMALSLVPCLASADDWMDSVLDEARQRYHSHEQARDYSDEEESEGLDARSEDHPFYPVQLSFVPFLSVPFGYIDTSVSLGYIGAADHNVYGFMGSGVFNMSHDIVGVQGAGVFNMSHDIVGFQGAGVFNMSHNVAGFQGAGVFNIAHDVRLAQGAGVFNIAGDVAGTQLAGVFNIAQEVRGLQAAGVFNGAGYVAGVQMGLINVADEIDGVQLGLVNIARDGANGLGVAYEPSNQYWQAYWQNGTRTIYTVVGAEMPQSELFALVDHLVVTAGIGTRIGGRHGTRAYLDIEALAGQEIGSRLGKFEAYFSGGDPACLDPPYPELRLRLGLPLGGIHLVGGLALDFDLASWPMVPAGLKAASFSMPETQLFGESFTTYGRWFFGVRI